MNILFYKYQDNKGNHFISAKSKGTPFISNSPFGNFLTNSLIALGYTVKERTNNEDVDGYFDEKFIIPKVDLFNNPPNQFIKKLAQDETIQSMSFELCGKLEPHLVKVILNLLIINGIV